MRGKGKGAALPGTSLVGTVLAVQANYYWVRLDGGSPAGAFGNREASPAQNRLLCTRRSRLKKIGQRVMVGDRVGVEEPDWQGGRGAIAEVLPRRSLLDRPPVANADRILLVFSLAEPPLDPHQLGRFLVKAESTWLSVDLCLNKRELVPPEERDRWRAELAAWGYDPAIASVRENPHLPELRDRLAGRVTVLAGPSGTGKSSTINALVPDADLRVGAVSGKLARGRHTTRHVELFELPSGGLLADTPGFNQPALTCGPRELARCFPEIRIRQARDRCQYADCLHRDEPGCAVRGPWTRYPLYLELLEEAIAYEASQQRTADAEDALKRKTGRDGRDAYEPRLASKKYRRQSRRSQHQALDALDPDELLTATEADETKLESLEALLDDRAGKPDEE